MRTRIVDGEIIREDDVSASQPQPASRQTSTAGARVLQTPPLDHVPRGTGTGQAVFDFSAAPVAVHRDPEDHSFFGLPGLKIFGALFQSKHLVALLAATLFLGWKGFALGVIVWIFYKLSQKPAGGAGAAPAAGGQQGPVQLPAFLQQYMQEPPAGQREYRSGMGPVGGRSGQAGSGQRSGSWAGRGQAHRLGTASAPSQ